MKETTGWVIAAILGSLIALSLIGWGVYAGHEGREKNDRQFNACIESGGTWVGGYSDLCIKNTKEG